MDPSAVLTRAIEKISVATELTTITQTVAEAARVLAGSDGATFVLREGEECCYADENALSPLWKGRRFPIATCISGWSMLNREIVVIPDIFQDPRIPHDAYRPTFVKSLCMMPIRAEEPIGAIGAYWAQHHVATEEETKLLQVLANSTAVALENLGLKQAIQRHGAESAGLKDRTRALEDALFTMAHDLRGPVGAMSGLADLLEVHLGSRQDELSRNYLHAICETGRQTMAQIERMLALYRVTNGQIQKKTVSVTSIAERIMSDLRAQFPGREIQFSVESGLNAFADPALLHLVLENLLNNAVKYSAKKPNVSVQVGCSHRQNDSVTFFVRDHGDGFDAEQSHKLFRPLGRLHSGADFHGTGLGLASVAKIVEAHGGSVRAEGKKSEGATFYFSLPAA